MFNETILFFLIYKKVQDKVVLMFKNNQRLSTVFIFTPTELEKLVKFCRM